MNGPAVDHRIESWFFGTWVVLGLLSYLVFFVCRDAALKRRWFPWFVALGGVLFLAFVTALGYTAPGPKDPPTPFLFVFMAFWVALISVMNVRMIKFCDGCGRTVCGNGAWTKQRYCQECGAKYPDVRWWAAWLGGSRCECCGWRPGRAFFPRVNYCPVCGSKFAGNKTTRDDYLD